MNTEGEVIDYDRTTCLCDVGAPEYLAATLVTRDGQTRLVLVHKDLIGDAQPGYDPDCRGASHEQPGRLPRYWANRIAALQEWHAILGEAGQMLAAENRHRCGRPTKTGRRCRAAVARPGIGCSWHRDQRKDVPQ